MVAVPIVLVALFIAAYWAYELVRLRSRPPDWRWPQSESDRPFPISLSRDRYGWCAVAGIIASLVVAVFAVVTLG